MDIAFKSVSVTYTITASYASPARPSTTLRWPVGKKALKFEALRRAMLSVTATRDQTVAKGASK
eukprot:3834254-Heterocapsa_arctica.AAC.1